MGLFDKVKAVVKDTADQVKVAADEATGNVVAEAAEGAQQVEERVQQFTDQLPEGFKLPEGFDPANLPEGFDPANLPEGFNPQNRPQGGFPGGKPQGFPPQGAPDFAQQAQQLGEEVQQATEGTVENFVEDISNVVQEGN